MTINSSLESEMQCDLSIFEPLGFTTNGLVHQLRKDVQEVFNSMAGIKNILPATMRIVAPIKSFEHSITAMIGLAGTYDGTVSLHTPMNLAMDFTAGMLGMAVTELDDDVLDALGEISNMVAGSVKDYLSRSGAILKISTPSVVAGDKYRYLSGNQSDTLTLGFTSGAHLFLVCVTVLVKQFHNSNSRH